MEDFFYEIKQAAREGNIAKLVKELNGDPNIKISTSKKPVRVLGKAFHASNGPDSLEQIAAKTKKLNREVPFAGIMLEPELIVTDFYKGKLGSSGMCSWDEGNLLERSYERARNVKAKVSLGHTHPVFNGKHTFNNIGWKMKYGAVCSDVYYRSPFLRTMGDEISLKILESRIYRKYGGDYCEMFMRAKEHELVSDFFWILSPRIEQAAVFEIKSEGRVIYHPWEVI